MLAIDHVLHFPHEQSHEPVNTKDIIQSSDFVLAEVSHPSTGQGIELAWADEANTPIIGCYRDNADYSSSLKMLNPQFMPYSTPQNLAQQLLAIFSC